MTAASHKATQSMRMNGELPGQGWPLREWASFWGDEDAGDCREMTGAQAGHAMWGRLWHMISVLRCCTCLGPAGGP